MGQVLSLSRWLCLSPILLFLGCSAASTPHLDLPIDTSITPAAAELSGSIGGLVHQTKSSYLALVVGEPRTTRLKRQSGTLPEKFAAGSGFVIDKGGTVVTAAHVAGREGSLVEARAANGRIYAGRVIKIHPDNDLALIKLSGFSGASVTPAVNACMRRGEPIFSLGKPYPQPDLARLGEVKSMTFGRTVRYQDYGYPDAMVLKIGTRKGESGGPVFNRDGKLAGMVVSTLSDIDGTPLDFAHAIPTPALARFICKSTHCSKNWQDLIGQDVSRCG